MMPRIKTQLLTKQAQKDPGKNAPRLLQRAAANKSATVSDRRAAQVQRVNESSESVIAVIVRSGESLSTAELEIVPAGAAVTPDAGQIILAFINDQGIGQRFGATGGTRLSRAQTAQEYPGLAARAVRMLKSSVPSTAVGVHRAVDPNSAASGATVEHAMTRSSCMPLPDKQLRRLESSYGTQLGHVRLHTDAAADQAARSVQAHAFTTGSDIYFRTGKYAPDTAAGQHLLAHEVAHTVQQQNGVARIAARGDSASALGAYQLSQPHDHLEVEAESAATQAMQGRRARLSMLTVQPHPGSLPAPLIARRAAEAGSPNISAPVAPAVDTPAPASKAPVAKSTPGSNTNDENQSAPAKKQSKKDSTKAPTDAVKDQARPAQSRAEGKASRDVGDKPEAKSGGKKSGQAGLEATDGAAVDAKAVPGSAAGKSESGLKSVLDTVSAEAEVQKQHDSVESKQQETVQAVDVTPEEAEGQSKAAKGKQLGTAQKLAFNKEAFKEALRAKIRSLKAEDAKQIKEGDQAQAILTAAKSGVAEGKQSAAADIAQKSAQPAPEVTPTPGAPLPAVDPGPKPKVDATGAVPAPVDESKVSLSNETQTLDGQLTAASVTPEQLRAANEPTFQAAADAHQSAKSEADALPANARAQESQVLKATQADMVATTDSGLAQMSQGRASKLNASAEKQQAGKAKYEATRARINKQLSEVYATTEKSVNERMAKIDKDVAQAFDDAAFAAKARFYAFLATRLLIYYASGTWLVEAIAGGNTKEKIFKQAQDDFEADMLRVVDSVADIVEAGLNEVINIIATGRANLEAELARLDPADRAIGNEVASEFRNQFAQLEKSVEEKQTAIIESVAQKYHEAQKSVESTIATLRNPVGALIDLAKEQIAGVIETILNLKTMLFGLLAKASAAIDLIIKDPIGFLGNLVSGVKLGLLNFVSKIGTYLQKGLLEWLFGALAGAGIQLPDKFDLSGLFSIVLQVLGLTWANIRARAVKIVGENTVKVLETGSEIIVALVTKGVAGLWEYVKEQAVTLIETVKEGIKSFVMESVIVAGVKWLIGLLNPASAFVKACMAIYDIVMFIVNRGQQILAFVNAVLDSVLSIAQGAIGVAATAVENALARALPVAIGFLASLLGLGDLSGKIRKVIDKIQEPVNKVIDWVINKAVKLVKSIAGALGIGKKKPKTDEDPSGVRALALTRVQERTVGQTNPDTIRKTLEEIQNELKPQGLVRLYLQEEKDGSFEVRAQASPDKTLLKFAPKFWGLSVRLVAKIVFEARLSQPVQPEQRGPYVVKRKAGSNVSTPVNKSESKPAEQEKQDTTSGEDRVKSIVENIIGKEKFEETRRGKVTRKIATVDTDDGAVPGVKVAMPEPGARHLDVVSFNTTDSKPNNNQSHAEHQLANFIRSIASQWHAIESIHIEISKSPCGSHCVSELIGLADDITRARDGRETTYVLNYKSVFPDTYAEDLARLRSRWSGTGPQARSLNEIEPEK